jgi:hypothetical protein
LSWDGTGGINPGELPIPFTSETIDTGAADFGTQFHSNSVNISRITIPAGVSIVRLTGQIQWDLFHQNGSGAWFMRIIKNGLHFGTVDPGMGDYFPMVHGLFFGGFADANGDGRMAHVVTTVPINVSQGDYFELTTMSQGSDFGDLRITGGTSAFSCEVLG